MSKLNYDYKPLQRDGKCLNCSRFLKAHGEKVLRFENWINNYPKIYLCRDCMKDLVANCPIDILND